MSRREFDHRFFIDYEKSCLSYVPQKCGWATYYRSLIADSVHSSVQPLYKEDFKSVDKVLSSFYKIFHFRNPYSRLASAIADKFIEARDDNFLRKLKREFSNLYTTISEIKSKDDKSDATEGSSDIKIIHLVIKNLPDIAKFDPHFKDQVIFINRYGINLDWFDEIQDYKNNLRIIKEVFGVSSKENLKVRNKSHKTHEIEAFLRQDSFCNQKVINVYSNDFRLLEDYL